jgi:hypothetical protein
MNPLRSRYVTVRIAAYDSLPAVVESETERTLVLSLAVRTPKDLEGALARPVRVECSTPRGIQRVTGLAHWDPARPDELRVQRGSEELIQRREAVRVDAVVAGLLIAVEGQSARAATTTVNVSGTGMLVRDPLGLAMGERIRLELELEAGARPVTVEGRVVREAGGDAKGLAFEAVSRADQDRLARFIAARQRAELRVGR